MNIIVLRRRLIYICAMVALVVPLYFLGNPSVRDTDGSIKSPGGTLAQIRSAYNLEQGDLGEIDPASESMRLATLGLRGVAATILWQKAEYYKKEQYWDRLSATLNQIAALQPHFIEIWKFQSHNLSYNVSSEFDNFRHRYDWVKRGMEYLVKGSKLNKNRTEMPFELGWFFGNKFGVADERKQFRELYRNDENFHAEIFNKTGLDVNQAEGTGPDQKPDNWKSGRLWYERSYDMVDQGAKPAKSTMMFYRQGPQWLMKYSEAIQEDGFLDTAAYSAWHDAAEQWTRFGKRPILTTFGDTIYLTEIDLANEAYAQAKEDFAEFCGETYQRMFDKRWNALSDEERQALDLPYADRDFQQVLLAENAQTKLFLAPEAVAKEVPDDIRVDALQMAKDLETMRKKIDHIEIYRNQINYAYWEQRCVAEQEDSAMLARTSMYEADQLLERGELDEAFAKYEAAWRSWDALFNKHPAMMIDEAADQVMEAIERYRRLLDTSELPEDFALKKFLQFRIIYEDQFVDPAMMGVMASWTKNYPGRDFLDEMLRKSEGLAEAIGVADPVIPDDNAQEPDSQTPGESNPLPPAEDDQSSEPRGEPPSSDAAGNPDVSSTEPSEATLQLSDGQPQNDASQTDDADTAPPESVPPDNAKADSDQPQT